MIDLSPAERKQAYITLVQEQYKPVKQKWWKSTKTHYHLTKELAKDNYKRINRTGAAEFKKGKTGAFIATGIFALSILGTFFIDRVIAFFTLFGLLIFLAMALPRLLDKKVMIRITGNGIWADGLRKEISWNEVLLTYIKEVENDEDSVFTLIIHYYDPVSDQFLKTETKLDAISIHHLSATIGFYKNGYIPTY